MGEDLRAHHPALPPRVGRRLLHGHFALGDLERARKRPDRGEREHDVDRDLGTVHGPIRDDSALSQGPVPASQDRRIRQQRLLRHQRGRGEGSPRQRTLRIFRRLFPGLPGAGKKGELAPGLLLRPFLFRPRHGHPPDGILPQDLGRIRIHVHRTFRQRMAPRAEAGKVELGAAGGRSSGGNDRFPEYRRQRRGNL